ncbi:MAG: nucleoside deaminase [Clostridiales bacterium]|nr:nucleoside deaminase [Clostridiales bacterium]
MENKFMKEALKEAKKAVAKDEVPVGAVIVHKDKIIARGHNQKESKNDATLHAEIVALKKAYKKLGTWRLNECDMYVTLEPCAMCSGAIIQSRMHNLIFGAYDLKGGCVTSKFNLFEKDKFNHNVNVVSGCMEEECSKILKDFFKNKR